MIIGIGGVSRSGKTTLARQLVPFFNGKKTIILSQDDYVLAGYNAPLINGIFDWEHPGSIDFPRMRYDFFSTKPFVDVLIIEGIFAFHDEAIAACFDMKLYMQLDFLTFYNRKKADNRWGEVPDWYIGHIWRSHQKFGLPAEQADCYNLDGSQEYELEGVLQYLGIPIPYAAEC